MRIDKPNLKPSRISCFFLLFFISVIFTLASAEILLWTDDMTDFPFLWTVGGTGGPWTQVSNRYNSASYSAKCTPNLNYSINQNNWMQRSADLTGYVNAAVTFQIWQNTYPMDSVYFEYYSGGSWTTIWSRAGDYGGFTQQVMIDIPNTATAIRFRFVSNDFGVTEGVYIDDVNVWGFRYDVGCTQIIAPTAITDSGQSVTPQARVENLGDFAATFFARMSIGSNYNDSVQVINLPVGNSTVINFTNWNPLQRGIYPVRCSTELPTDINPTNDRTTCSTQVRVRNVGTVSIIAPSGATDSGQVFTPRAVIRNYGTTTETFTVNYWISPSYLSARSVTLIPSAAETTNFDPWTALSRGTQTIRCSTALAGDMVTSDDRQTGSVMVRVRDVGTTTILTPTGFVDSTATLLPQAKVKNYGTNQETLDIKFRIAGPSNWSTTAIVLSLNPNEERTLTFAAWNIGPRGNYTTRCSTALTGDQISVNDKLDSSFVVRVHDVGVASITFPLSAVDSNSTVPVAATVQNFGTESETFSAMFRISSSYTSSRTVTLAPGDSQLVNFDNWLVNRTRGTYTARCTTILASDAKPSNNRKTKSVSINVHDVGVAAFVSPIGKVDTNTVVTVSAQIWNYGTYAETLSVVFEIGTFYASARSITLAASNITTVTFDNWTVTQPRGSYALKCSTLLNSDINPNNNYQTGSITVRVRDVGVVTINSPFTADSAAKVTVSAQIINYGSEPETFAVQFRIGSFYSSAPTLTLNPNAASLVTFDDWTVLQPRGSYATKCTTLLAGDVHCENDYQNGAVTIKVHDAGVINIISPPATVDSNSTVAVAATIKNYGTESESLAVLLRLGSFYTSSRTANIAAGGTQIVIFDNWLVTQPRNTYAVRCTTQLASDANPTNNLSTSNVTINVHDAGVIAITSPPSIVDTNSITPITAQIRNYGTYSETFNVTFKIGSFYTSNRPLTIAAGNTSVVTFDTWTVTQPRGSYAKKCSTALSSDFNPNNNYQTGTVMVRVRDVGVVAITSPPSIVDTNTKTPVSAQIRNYGTNAETFNVIFKIGTFYTSTRSIIIAAGNTSACTFDTWTVTQPRGTYATKCSTALSSDVIPNNNYQTGSVTLRVHDVGVTAINAPALVDTAEIVPISSVVINCGTEPETFTAQFRIGSFYSSNRTTTLNPGSSNTVTFDTWTVTQPRGSYATKCSTLLSNDAKHFNDYQNGTVAIRIHDVGIVGFSGVPLMTDSGIPIPIKVNVANYGTFDETFNVHFNISPDYNCTRQISLPAGLTSQVVFDTWTPLIRSNHTAQCTTELSNDENQLNDNKNDSIFVVVRDIWAEEILAPIDTATLGRTLTPKVRFENLGNLTATFPAWLKITWGVMQVYLDTVIVNLAPGTPVDIDFMSWHPDSIGIHFSETHCQLPADMHTDNDVQYGEILIQTYTPWFQKNDLAVGSGKKVKQGGSLVYVPDNTIYALKGSNTNEFFRYNIATDTWTQICSIPYTAKVKKVKNGAALCYGNGNIYAFKGNNTCEFWRYATATDSWYLKKPVPLGSSLKRIKAGTGMVYVTKGDSNFVYALKANKTNEFYAYWVEMDSWLERKPVPATPRPMAAGSCITFDGANTIYALAGKTNEFYAYDILADTWLVKPMMPYYGSMNKKKKTKDGAALAADEAGLVYAFKGNNTNELWAYSVNDDTWLIKEPIPEGALRKRVKAGGALCFDNLSGRLYGFKGGNTREFWMYVPVMGPVAGKLNSPAGTMSNSSELSGSQFTLNISPNPIARTANVKYTLTEPGNVTLKLFDISGKLVKIVSHHTKTKGGTIILNRDKLPSGIYILRLETSRGNLTKKIIITVVLNRLMLNS